MKKLFIWLLVFISFSACKKKDTGISDDSTFFARFNGYTASISTQTPPGKGVAGYSASNTPISGSQSIGSYSTSLSNHLFSVIISKQLLTFSGNGIPAASEFQAFFNTGDVPYYSGSVENGIAVDYIDKNGITWNSERGDQTGSVFTITRSEASGSNVKIEAEFNCKLFDSNGDSLQLSGGTFTGQFRAQ